jgi:hypothetical protein
MPRPPPATPVPPPPPLCLSSCLAPLAHRYCRCRRFCCSLLIVVCPRRCHCCCRRRRRRLCFQHRHCRPPSKGHRHNFCRHISCPHCLRDHHCRTSRRRRQQCGARPTSKSSLSVGTIILVPMFPPPPLPLSPPTEGCCFRCQCGCCFRGCCHLPAAMVMTCCSAKVNFSQHSTLKQLNT